MEIIYKKGTADRKDFNVKLIINKTSRELSARASSMIAGWIKKGLIDNGRFVLGLTAGCSASAHTYIDLTLSEENSGIDWKYVHIFQMEEITGDLPESGLCRKFIEDNFTKLIDIPEENVHMIDGALLKADPDRYMNECRKKLENAGGLDLLVLSQGSGGSYSFISRADLVPDKFDFLRHREKDIVLAAAGRETVKDARRTVLISSGEDRADGLSKLIKRSGAPASAVEILRESPDLTVFAQSDAASMLLSGG